MTREEIIERGYGKFPQDIIEIINDDGSIMREDVNFELRKAYMEGLIDNNISLPSDLDEAAVSYANRLATDAIDHELIKGYFRAGAEWMAGKYKTLGETEIYLEDDGGEEPYTQEWLDLATTEFAVPEGFKPGDKVIVQIRKK